MLKLVFMLGFIKVIRFRMNVTFYMMTYLCNQNNVVVAIATEYILATSHNDDTSLVG